MKRNASQRLGGAGETAPAFGHSEWPDQSIPEGWQTVRGSEHCGDLRNEDESEAAPRLAAAQRFGGAGRVCQRRANSNDSPHDPSNEAFWHPSGMQTLLRSVSGGLRGAPTAGYRLASLQLASQPGGWEILGATF
jgi:hypothetical protein